MNGVSSTSVIVNQLTPGLSYSFVVKARNVIGYSEYSTSINVLAAQIPDPPSRILDVPNETNAE
jgi:hypothetical protein